MRKRTAVSLAAAAAYTAGACSIGQDVGRIASGGARSFGSGGATSTTRPENFGGASNVQTADASVCEPKPSACVDAGAWAGSTSAPQGECDGGTQPSGPTVPTAIRLPLQPADPGAGWQQTFGLYGKSCNELHYLNPSEAGFSNVCTPGGPGVTFATASNEVACCTCIGRTKRFILPKMLDANRAVLRATWFGAERPPCWPLSIASLRIDVGRTSLPPNTSLASVQFAAEQRQADGCGFGDCAERRILAPGPFDFPLAELGFDPGTLFDQVDVTLQGTGCGATTNSITLGDLEILVG
jgi:hypothetical protein